MEPVQVDIDMPETYSLWNYGGSFVIAGPKMDQIRYETIKAGLPGKMRQAVVGWRTIRA